MRRIYLDHNATTPVHPEVLDAMLPWYQESWGNASSIHWAGRGPRDAIDGARESVAALIGAPARDLYFTSGGTESDNAALLGVVWASRGARRHVITSAIEHKAILDTCKALETLHGVEVTRLPVDDRGRHDLDALAAALRDDTALVSLMLANNELGNLNDVAGCAAIAHARGVPVHCDAVNALGKVPVDARALDVDLMTVSAHKIWGPKGVGALYVRKKTPFEPLIRGGGQEKGQRCGTYNTAGIVGFGKAAELSSDAVTDAAQARTAALRDRLESALMALPGVERNGDPDHRLPNTSNLSFDGVDGEGLVLGLDLQGLAISTGSACTSGSLDPSHVLVALGKDPRWLAAALRFSLGRDTTLADVDDAAALVIGQVQRLRALRSG